MFVAALTVADMGWGGHMGDWGAGWWILMAIGMVVFWGLVILGVVWLVRSFGPGQHGHAAPDAHQVLDQRLARGEISSEEYHERSAVLRDHGANRAN
jgi:Predicted membrane protein